jgi:predicted nucleic acid-binding protein
MITAVDTNILIDLFTGPQADAELATSALRNAAFNDTLLLSVVCYSELAARFALQSNLKKFLDQLGLRIDELDRETSFVAGRLYHQYRRRGGERTRILPDFLIAAHAQLHADRLLTRDKRFFTTIFPKLKAVSPADLA